MGTLYIVATPIGNLQDITLRAIKTLFETPVIVCEDTRRTSILLSVLKPLYHKLTYDTQKINGEVDDREKNINKPRLISYYEQNELQRIPEIISLLLEGKNAALVSDAGTPTISDPGFKLVRACIEQGIKVESIPGPSSVTTALVSSGLPTDKFMFIGYLPKKPGHRITLLQDVFKCFKTFKHIQHTLIFFEAPHKLLVTLSEMQEVFGDIPIVVTRELTKIHEEIRRETISESIVHFQKTKPKGEFVILFNLKVAGVK